MTTTNTQQTSARIIKATGRRPVYHKYPGQFSPQPAFVELDCGEKTLLALWSGELGTGVPMQVYRGHRQWWRINPELTCRAVNALLKEIAPLAEVICEGYEEAWDGHNMVARFSPEAREAIDEVARICEDAEP